MKTKRAFLIVLFFLLQTSCNSFVSSSDRDSPLRLTLEIPQDEFSSFEDVRGLIILENQSENTILVNRRLSFLPQPAEPEIIEGVVLIKDSSGMPIYLEAHVQFESPNADMFSALKPHSQIAKKFSLRGLGFAATYFKSGEKYTIIAIYQNKNDVSKTIGGVVLTSWIGSVQSNEETFIILR